MFQIFVMIYFQTKYFNIIAGKRIRSKSIYYYKYWYYTGIYYKL